jgi:hypothetical protein
MLFIESRFQKVLVTQCTAECQLFSLVILWLMELHPLPLPSIAREDGIAYH